MISFTPYQSIAKRALINWNNLSEEEAYYTILGSSVEELESQVYAMGSVEYAVAGIANIIGLSEEESEEFFKAVVYGPVDSEIFDLVRMIIEGFSEIEKLDVLSCIHDGWVKSNASEKTFNKKVSKKQLRQYAPIELIGWNEVKSDMLFLDPILEFLGVYIDEESLRSAYYDRVESYMRAMHIYSEKDLTDLISTGRDYYPVLPDELESRLLPMSEDVSEQITQNWESKDPKSAEIMANLKVSVLKKKPTDTTTE